jgi:hypothetical protein
MTADLVPNFPSVLGAEHGVEFVKDGHMYRLARSGETTWVIHRQGEPDAGKFELRLTGDGRLFDVEGRNGLVVIHAMGASVSTIFTKLF